MADAVRTVKAYFDTLDQRFRADKAAGVDAVFQWLVSGSGGGAWHAIVRDGALQVAEGTHPEPTVTISIAAPDYLLVLNGKMAGAKAVFTRKMKVSGSIRMARKMEELLPPGPPARAATKPAAKATRPKTTPKPRGKPLATVGKAAQAAGEWQPRVALVTGASGFIGSHVVKELLAEGVRVRALVQAGVPLSNLDGLDVEQVPGDLLDPASLRRALEGVDTVLHFAAIYAMWLPDPALMYRVNVEGTLHLLEAALAAGVGRFVHCSSFATVGLAEGRDVADETTAFNHWATADHYVLSKYMSELEALKFNLRGLPVVVVNPSFPFGGGDIAPTPTGILVQRFAYGQSPVVMAGGINAVHVGDVARGAWLAARRGRPGERYILGNVNMTYKEFGAMVCQVAGQKPPRFEVPVEPLARLGRVNEWISDHITHKTPLLVDKGLRFAGGRFLYCSVDKARRELGYEPRPIEEAIEEAVVWFKYGPLAPKKAS
ncbi:MAG: NAD-dependent epimerase/dehydratase family protein [Deltaproteobacteria bacterium]|nr:NAD-dependent epimerase/dehydratase family protein [Deltaproteobacteria bacterium]MCB9788477.1 NAD-dependent epimerase/dehydratase family protein [Deltaproteobacteria bacterium]